MSDPEEARPLLLSSGQRQSRLPTCCLLIVAFLEAFTFGGIDLVYRHDNINCFYVKKADYGPWLLVGAVIAYFLPILSGLYTDVVIGRYTSVFFGLGLKLSGSLITFVATLLCETLQPTHSLIVKLLFAFWVIGVLCFCVGTIIVIPAGVTFLLQQAKQTAQDVACISRWLFVVCICGILVEAVAQEIHTYTDFFTFRDRYYQTVRHSILLAADGLSVAVFLFGKSMYKDVVSRTENGQKSGREMLRIIKKFIFCQRPVSDPGNLFWGESRRRLEEQRRMKLDRLMFKKGILMVALLSCLAVAQSMNYTLDLVYLYTRRNWEPMWLPHIVDYTKSMVVLPAALAIDGIRRYTGHHVWENTSSNRLKTIGIGAGLAAVALLLAGFAQTAIFLKGYQSVSVLWLLPEFLVMGVATVMIYPSMITLCYLESPPGLASTVFALAACLALLSMAIQAVINAALPDRKYLDRYDYIYYILAGVMVAVVGLYIAVSLLYSRAERAIREAMEEEVTETWSRTVVNDNARRESARAGNGSDGER